MHHVPIVTKTVVAITISGAPSLSYPRESRPRYAMRLLAPGHGVHPTNRRLRRDRGRTGIFRGTQELQTLYRTVWDRALSPFASWKFRSET